MADASGRTAGGALTPERAPDYLEGLSAEVRACVLLDASGAVTAVDRGHETAAPRLRELPLELLGQARDAAAAAGLPEPAQVEVSTGAGIVYALRERGWTLAVVAGRFALSSLVLFDMRQVLAELEATGA